jgi:hypothetical protein
MNQRICLGRNAVLRKALGNAEEDEYMNGLRLISAVCHFLLTFLIRLGLLGATSRTLWETLDFYSPTNHRVSITRDWLRPSTDCVSKTWFRIGSQSIIPSISLDQVTSPRRRSSCQLVRKFSFPSSTPQISLCL